MRSMYVFAYHVLKTRLFRWDVVYHVLLSLQCILRLYVPLQSMIRYSVSFIVFGDTYWIFNFRSRWVNVMRSTNTVFWISFPSRLTVFGETSRTLNELFFDINLMRNWIDICSKAEDFFGRMTVAKPSGVKWMWDTTDLLVMEPRCVTFLSLTVSFSRRDVATLPDIRAGL